MTVNSILHMFFEERFSQVAYEIFQSIEENIVMNFIFLAVFKSQNTNLLLLFSIVIQKNR